MTDKDTVTAKTSPASDSTGKENDKIVFKKEENHTSTLSILAAFIIILVIISVLAYRSGIDIKQVQSDIAGFKNNLAARYAKDGVAVDFNYGEVKAEGGILSQNITIANPELKIVRNNQDYVLSAPMMTLIPDDSYYNAFEARLASPVSLAMMQNQRVYRFNTTKPISVVLYKNDEGLREYNIVLQDKGALDVQEADVVKHYALTFGEGSNVSGVVSDTDTKALNFEANFNNATFNEGTLVSKADNFQYMLDKNAQGEVEEMHVENLMSDYIPAGLVPLSLDLTQRMTQDVPTGNVMFNLEQFIVNNEHYNVDVEGDFSVVSQEILPLANIRATVSGATYILNALQQSNTLPASVVNIIAGSLQKIAPEWKVGSEEPLHFTIERTADKPFMIGNIKADELFAVALKEWYAGNAMSADKPSSSEAPSQVTPPNTPDAQMEGNVNGQPVPAQQSPSSSGVSGALNGLERKMEQAAESVGNATDKQGAAIVNKAGQAGDRVSSKAIELKHETAEGISNGAEAVQQTVGATANTPTGNIGADSSVSSTSPNTQPSVDSAVKQPVQNAPAAPVNNAMPANGDIADKLDATVGDKMDDAAPIAPVTTSPKSTPDNSTMNAPAAE